MATRKFKPFTPYGTPPPDRYDPALDFQLAAGERGLGDTVTDAATQGRRGVEDYGFGVHDARLQQSRGLEDIGTRRTALDTQRGYASADHQRALDMLTRQYGRQAIGQAQQARVMGVAGGGTLIQAARKRAENQAFDQQPIDTGFNRQNAALDVEGQQLDTAQSRLNEDTGTGIARLGVNLERGISDAGLGVQRAGREQIFLGTDTAGAKAAQAASTGWDPGPKPKNEFTGGPLGDRRVIRRGNTDYVVDPSGKVLSTRPRRR